MGTISEIPISDPLHCIYFYYLQFVEKNKGEDAAPVVTAYYHFDEDTAIKDDQHLEDLVTKLGANARAGDFAPPSCGSGISAVPWRRKSYLVILLDHPVLKFRDKHALQIICKKKPGEPINHSFFNARKLNIDLPGDGSGAVVTALSCVNLMQHEDGRDLEDNEEEKFAVSVIPGGPLRYRDDSGTNQGGPIPPPAARL